MVATWFTPGVLVTSPNPIGGEIFLLLFQRVFERRKFDISWLGQAFGFLLFWLTRLGSSLFVLPFPPCY
jgi:hypothetical protein